MDHAQDMIGGQSAEMSEFLMLQFATAHRGENNHLKAARWSCPLWGYHCTCGLISLYSGRVCVKSLRSSYMGLYPQTLQR